MLENKIYNTIVLSSLGKVQYVEIDKEIKELHDKIESLEQSIDNTSKNEETGYVVESILDKIESLEQSIDGISENEETEYIVDIVESILDNLKTAPSNKIQPSSLRSYTLNVKPKQAGKDMKASQNIHIHDLDGMSSNFDLLHTYKQHLRSPNIPNTTLGKTDMQIRLNDFYPEIKIINPEIDVENILVKEVRYEQSDQTRTYLNSRENLPETFTKIVKHVIIESLTPEVDKQLAKFGLKPIKMEIDKGVKYKNIKSNHTNKDKNKLYILYPRELTRIIMHGQSSLKDILVNRYGLFISYDLVTIKETSFNSIPHIKSIYKLDNTRLDKLDTWYEKMKILGLVDDYEISDDGAILNQYKGKDTNPSMPPVIEINMENKLVKHLTLPSTLETLGRIPMGLDIDTRKSTRLHKSLLIEPFLYNPEHKNKEIDLRNLTISCHKNFITSDAIHFNFKLNYLHLIGVKLSQNRIGWIELYDIRQ